MYSSNFREIDILNESRVKQVMIRSKSLEELYGENLPANKFLVKEPVEPNELQILQLQYENEWNAICNSDWYAHIRICGRVAQDQSESNSFMLDDLFRIYRYSLNGFVNTRSDVKIDYNANANLWVFYIAPLIEGDKERYIWIQAPKRYGSIRVVYKGMSKSNGILIDPYERNKSGFKYINQFKDQLKEITSQYYDTFKQIINIEADLKFKSIAGRFDSKPSVSKYEWPVALLYNRD